MNNGNGTQVNQRHTNRRGFLTLIGATAVTGSAVISVTSSHFAYADGLTKAQRDRMSTDEILELMKQGNDHFRSGEEPTSDYIAQQRATANGQHPLAIILSCIDSRAPAEKIMDLGIGDIFNSRVAGNIANDDILGSMEFACQVAGAKVVLVMGHTACGAIEGAIDKVELGNLTGLLAKIRPAVDATTYQGDRSSANPAFVDAVAAKNVQLTMGYIRANSQVLRDLESSKTIKIAGAMYNLQTAKLDFLV